MSDLMKDLQPHIVTLAITLLTAAGVILTALAGAVALRIKRWADKQDEAVDRNAIHQALKSGVDAARADGIIEPAAQAEKAVIHAYESVPRALKNIKPSSATLARVALAKTTEKPDA
jgi:hypothetical protein